jgi:hypothetical protein
MRLWRTPSDLLFDNVNRVFYIIQTFFVTVFKFLHDSRSRRWIHEKKLLVAEAMGIYFWGADGDSFCAYNDAHGRSRVRRSRTDRDCQSRKRWCCKG